MIRSILKLILVLCLGILIVFAYQTKGHVDIRWQRISISMKMGTFLLLILLGTWILFYIFSFIKYLSQLSKSLKEYWRNRHEIEGVRYIEESISALAGGMQDTALRKAKKGSEMLKHSLLAKWVYASTIKETGGILDERMLTELISSESLGLAGYCLRVGQLLKQSDNERAIIELQTAIKRYPDSLWLLDTLFKLFIYQEDVSRAKEIAEKLQRRGQHEADSKIALCYLLKAKSEADQDKKIKYLQLAFDLEKANPIVAFELSRIYIAESRYKKAQAIIEQTWKYSRPSTLGDVYLDTLKGLNSEEVLSSVLKLLEISNASLEGYIVVIKACIKCEFYQKARYYLEKAIQANGGMSYKLFELRVELTQKDGAEKLDYSSWIKQLSNRIPFEGWQCAGCGSKLSNWEPVCGRCGDVNSCFWQGEHENESNFYAIKR